LSVRFTDDRKLQARGNYGINDRPQSFHNTQFDPCLNMSGEQIAERRNSQRLHIGMCHPIASVGNLWLELHWIEFINVQPTSPNLLKPPTLYRVQPARTSCSKKSGTGFKASCCLVDPAAGARTVAWKPVARRVRLVQRPHQRFTLARGRRYMRSEQLDSWVLRKMKKSAHECILQAIDRLRNGHAAVLEFDAR